MSVRLLKTAIPDWCWEASIGGSKGSKRILAITVWHTHYVLEFGRGAGWDWDGYEVVWPKEKEVSATRWILRLSRGCVRFKMRDGIPNMDINFDMKEAKRAAKTYRNYTDAEYIADEKAYRAYYAFTAHRCARHLIAALKEIERLTETANILSDDDAMKAVREGELPEFIGYDNSGDKVWQLVDGRWTWGETAGRALQQARTFTPERFVEKYGPISAVWEALPC